MDSLIQIIKNAEDNKTAIGHFNISDLAGLKAIFESARDLGVPVIIGTSEGEREFIGVKQAVALVRSLREEHDYPIFLNADHTYSFEGVREAVDAGYDAVIFDGAQLPFEENMKITKQCVEYAKSKNPDILVEGELGYIGKSSKLLDEMPEGASITEDLMTKPEEAKRFVEETGVDLLAPAEGNIHGMLKGSKNPNLCIDCIRKVRESARVPLVLHGGSGISDENFRTAIKAGISVVHINTEIRVAWRKGVEEGLRDNDQIAPYKILPPAVESIKKVVSERLSLFSKQN